MGFIVKSYKKLFHLSDDQNLDMWDKGFITVHDGKWKYYFKMEDLKPVGGYKEDY